MRYTIDLGCLVVVCWVGGAQEATKFEPSAFETKVLELTNAERNKEELPPLKVNKVLFKVARAHAANMAKQAKMEHDLDGKKPHERVLEAGYKFAWTGENIAYWEAELPAAKLVELWMKSKFHRENILDKEFTEIGIGVVRNDKGHFYYAQVFGTPR